MGAPTDIFSQILGLATPFAETFAKSTAYGSERASELELAKERVKLSQVNGSGPLDRDGFLKRSTGIFDQYFGNPFDKGSSVVSQAMPAKTSILPLLLIGGVIVLVVVLLFRKR